MSDTRMPTSVASAPMRNRRQWAEVIYKRWEKAFSATVEVGFDLIKAKEQLPHGEFHEMIREDLPFSIRTAQRLMQMARHPEIGGADDVSMFPVNWGVMAELVSIPPDKLRQMKEEGRITPDLKTTDARALRHAVNQPGVPTPVEARRIARETGVATMATDGHMYSGATDEEMESARVRRDQTYAVIDAVEKIGRMPIVGEWFEDAESWQLLELDPNTVKASSEWLDALFKLLQEVRDGQ